ncbi:DUF808 domain-containing protein [Neptuniibacter sp. CAU 1671]|uniref:DUF808 domain-containing protein n=1 Tax=Neptuniibacter sp. CAU 1671 TaxID=3032593 RepID=UPI0023DA4CFF|nr:DUF808 domain-containing protein [Neptuniibacter sp. CAU 1671]MDF2180622.1 DUF808 domain-containing protein [Neptuniibacter sp. CAU 1671]
MAIASLLTLLDDVATVLDDVAAMTKVAAKKTSGVLGDDLALNAQQVSGVKADRELPVVWAVAKGSLLNKAVLVPAALLISYFAPWAVNILLLMGGLFLCYEGAEKVIEKLFHNAQPSADAKPMLDEATKIKGAIRTDFILSAEIIVITLGVVASMSLSTQIGVLVLVAFLITLGVYGLVAAIVKLDDLGLYLYQKEGASQLLQLLGQGILRFAPILMKLLAIVGTLAMFLVGGGILSHTVPPVHHFIEWIETLVHTSGLLHSLFVMLLEGLSGLLAGLVLVVLLGLLVKLKRP